MKLVVGLGNPGERYEATRHNIGFMVVRKVAEAAGIALKRPGYQGLYGVGRVAGVETTLLLPQTFMNLSGASVGSACKSLGITPGDLVVIHDDIDLPLGRLRIKLGGGHGGHNGIRSIAGVLSDGEFYRIKVGVGRPLGSKDVAGYVLSSFAAAEQQTLGDVLDQASRAVSTLLTQGGSAAMNTFNVA